MYFYKSFSYTKKKSYLDKNKLVIIFLLLLSDIAFSQSQLDTLEIIITSPRIYSLSSRFDKQLNTYNLHSTFQFTQQYDNFNYNFLEDYGSTFIKSPDRSNSTQNHFILNTSYNFSPLITVGGEVSNNLSSDSRRIEINQSSISDAIGYSLITPYNFLSFAPFAGYENNRQIGQNDYGAIYGAEGYFNNLDSTDFLINSQLKFKNVDIFPRRNLERYLAINLKNVFGQNFSNLINYQYFVNRKDFYFAADSISAKQFGIKNNVQSRIETDNILQDNLNFLKFLNLFSLNLTGRVSWRNIESDTRYKPANILSPSFFDTRVNELKIDLTSSLSYNSESFDGKIRLNYSERDENNLSLNFPGANQLFYQESVDQQSQKNNISERISASIIGDIKFSSSDKLSFSLFQNKLRYDTPSPLNYDDRDELLSIVGLQYTKTFSPFFYAFLNMEGTFNHIVYIYSESSSNNNVNRIIKLSTGGHYRGKYFSSFNSFSVSANYTVYDFEDLVSNYQSYSFRQFTATDSSKIILGRDLLFNHYGYIKLSEQGNLFWASFSTQPTRYLAEIYSEPKLIVTYNNLMFGFGLRFYSLKTYNYNQSSKILDSRYNSAGPLTEISMLLYKALSINVTGWYEFINTNSRSLNQQATLTMQVNWNF
jgi:hypothetical protein